MRQVSSVLEKIDRQLGLGVPEAQISPCLKCVHQGVDNSIENNHREWITLVDTQLNRNKGGSP